MTKYLISFPSEAMVLAKDEFPIVSADAHAVTEEAKAAGVYVFGGGIEERVDPVLVSREGEVSAEIHPGSHIKGGSPCWNCPRAKRPLHGQGRSRSPAVARKNSGSSCTTPRARVIARPLERRRQPRFRLLLAGNALASRNSRGSLELR